MAPRCSFLCPHLPTALIFLVHRFLSTTMVWFFKASPLSALCCQERTLQGSGDSTEGCMVSCMQPWWLQGGLPFLPEGSRSSWGHCDSLAFHWSWTPLIWHSLALKCPFPEVSIFSISFGTTYLPPHPHSALHIPLNSFQLNLKKNLYYSHFFHAGPG